ncbi:phosphonopyruvate decarboxylase (macronuclear) [Tetrahymena thermophila SB210]|uniref:Phosphonopyruvate decarboxylase n=1 Tax=Tetrahymena thermophila (strain SB210) TaxID=312017 RepID=Q24BD4_TETTS|nr:phosphonopyruvate decarboxylase [Tetrahymena thermophila SB210]EAS05095.1 phosphonopyruvate decarboxylase [Tetrahymena thermophila SB210]|eukprot:XP_001025340.1 phosphonopyruvate decarboxylase [Tetrahymena thermophila SB210]
MISKIFYRGLQGLAQRSQLMGYHSKFFLSGKRETEELPYLELTRDFLDPKDFYQCLQKNGVHFFTGVPDSLLKDFCAYVSDHADPKNHIITANEGSAVALATGYHLATGKVPMVYLQNSGLGNIVNPIMSLAHRQVYGIPMILLIGWRGEPGKKDEPQHLVQGKTMNGLITEMGIQFEVLPDFIEGATEAVESAVQSAKKRKSPFALVVKRQCFTNYKLKNSVTNPYPLNREQALNAIIPMLGSHDVIVGSTGFLSRELYEIRDQNGQGHERDFLTVGSMGHAASIALGIANQKSSRNVWCFDGDGGLIMHLGSMTTVGQTKPNNYRHVLFNNEAHDSVGAQPTAAKYVDFCKLALASGYKVAYQATTEEEIKEKLKLVQSAEGPAFLEVKIKPGARKNLGRPKTSTYENKEQFMDFLSI